MTSPQVYEEVRGPFTALQLLDIVAGERGLLYLHDGNQAFLREGDTVQHILTLYDPWDEDYFVDTLDAAVRLVPHGPLTHAERWRLAQEYRRPVLLAVAEQAGEDLPASWGLFECRAPGVAMTALYREPEGAGEGFPTYAGQGMGWPYVVRLVELNGEATTARLVAPGPVAATYRTNLLGERLAALQAAPGEAGAASGVSRIQPCLIEVALRPYEVATIYLDLVPGRKEARGLDERRSVWATAHRVPQA
jgi:alpha-mannosidase